jgi:hypothetical protein
VVVIMAYDVTSVTIGDATKKSFADQLLANDVANREQTLVNLKPAVNAAVNKLDIFTKSGGAVPDATNILNVIIPDGSGYTARSRAAAYLSGTSQFIMADATDYWSKGDLAAEIKTAWLYAIWDGTGIVWALAGYSGFNMVPTTTTVGDDDYFLLEAGSTYTRNNAHYCVCVGKIRYEYDTGDAPDHTIQATVENAPQVIWNPKSNNVSGADITEYSVVSMVGATYGSAAEKAQGVGGGIASLATPAPVQCLVYINAGDTIHLGGSSLAASGNRTIYGSTFGNSTGLTIERKD